MFIFMFYLFVTLNSYISLRLYSTKRQLKYLSTYRVRIKFWCVNTDYNNNNNNTNNTDFIMIIIIIIIIIIVVVVVVVVIVVVVVK